jgi:hypothetical protein
MVANISQNTVDAALNYLVTNSDKIVICSAEPTSYAEATSTYKLGEALNAAGWTGGAGAFTGTIAGTTTRTIATRVISGAAVSGTGTATWAAIVKTTATTELLVVMDMTDQAVTSGNTWGAASVNVGIPRQ